MNRVRCSYPSVAATLALVLAIGGGTAVALKGHNSVRSDDIKNGQVSASDLKQPKVVKIKDNPQASTNPCQEAKTSVFCGADSFSGLRGWYNLGGPWQHGRFWIDGFGQVHLSGYVAQSFANPSTGALIFLLPKAYKPAQDIEFTVARQDDDGSSGPSFDGQDAKVAVMANGEVRATFGFAGDGISLDGITYLAK